MILRNWKPSTDGCGDMDCVWLNGVHHNKSNRRWMLLKRPFLVPSRETHIPPIRDSQLAWDIFWRALEVMLLISYLQHGSAVGIFDARTRTTSDYDEFYVKTYEATSQELRSRAHLRNCNHWFFTISHWSWRLSVWYRTKKKYVPPCRRLCQYDLRALFRISQASTTLCPCFQSVKGEINSKSRNVRVVGLQPIAIIDNWNRACLNKWPSIGSQAKRRYPHVGLHFRETLAAGG